MFEKSFSRRTFLKATAAAAAAGGVADAFSFGDWLKKAEAAEVKVVPSLCGSCSAECGMWIHVKNGRVWKATGQKDHPSSRGKLCARGHAALSVPYHKDRITHPMKRLGENHYIPITWDQAYSEISAKLKDLLDKYGPEPMAYIENPRPTASFYGKRFAETIGCSTTTTHHSICFNSRTAANNHVIGPLATADITNAKYVLFLGRNYAEGLSPSNTAALTTAHEKGVKIVIVDPRQNAACILANEWVPIRPGTDLGMLLAIAHILIKEELYDKQFVELYGLGFDEFKKAMEQYTPEWAQTVTDIPAAKIKEIAHDLGNNRPTACIEQGYKAPNGANYINGPDTFRMLAIVNGLLGNYGKKGGMNWPNGVKLGSLDKSKHPSPPKPKAKRCDGAGIKGEHPLAHVSAGSIPEITKRAMENKIKFVFTNRINPIRTCTDPEYMAKAFHKIDLHLHCDIQWSETARVADYVLPEPSFLEREDLFSGISGGRPGVTLRCQAIDVIHSETKPISQIITELSRYMGLEKYFNFTLEDVGTAMLNPLKLTLDDLRQKGTIMLQAPAPKPLAFATPSKKLQFASKEFAEHGYSAVPVWQAPLAKANKETFVLISGKQAIMSHMFSVNHPYVLNIAKKYALERIWINTVRAKKLGIKDGDLVEVTSPIASKKVRVKVTERVHPEAAWLPLGYGSLSPWLKTAYGFGVNPNDFVPFQIEPIGGACMFMEVTVKIKKVGD